MSGYTIRRDYLQRADVLALLQQHLDQAAEWSPACKVHALPAESLRQPGVHFFSAWDGETLAAIGALKELGEGRGELKSMRAADAYRGKGAGRAILLHLLEEARAQGMSWLGLETGNTGPFLPAHRLYERHGFRKCEAFGDYISDDFSLCMSRDT